MTDKTNTRPFYVRIPEDILTYPLVVRYDARPSPDEAIIHNDCFNASAWLSHVDGALDVLRQPDAWLDNSDFVAEQIELFVQWLRRCSGMTECSGFDIKQSSENFYILEKSTDGGMTWNEGFDFSFMKPVPTINTAVLTDTVHQLEETLEQIDQNGYDVVYPSSQNSPSDPSREEKNLALCYGLHEYLERWARFIENIANTDYRQPPTSAKFLQSFMETLGSGVGFGVSLGMWLAPTPASLLTKFATIGSGAGFLATVIKNWNDFWGGVGYMWQTITGQTPQAEKFVFDKELIQRMISHMYCELADKNINQYNWEVALSSFPTENSIEDAVLNVVMKMNLSRLSWAEFLAWHSYYLGAIQEGMRLPFQCQSCGDDGVCEPINIAWNEIDATPSGFTGYRRDQGAGAFIPLQRAPFNNWKHASDWQQIIVEHFPIDEGGCVPTLVYAQMLRPTLNSWHIVIETRDSFGYWTERARNSGGTGGTTGFKSCQWGNPINTRVYGVRVIAYTRRAEVTRYRFE